MAPPSPGWEGAGGEKREGEKEDGGRGTEIQAWKKRRCRHQRSLRRSG